MPSRNKLSAFIALASAALLQAQTVPPPDDLPKGTGPRGTSQAVPGAERYDAVDYAVVEPGNGAPGAISVTSRKVPVGGFVEVTALDSGKTIAAIVAAEGPNVAGRIIGLSPGAGAALGVGSSTLVPVRVRVIEPSQPDQVALRAGHAAGERLDTPQVLLTALRKRLPPMPAAIVPATAGSRRATQKRPTPPAVAPANAAVVDQETAPARQVGTSYAAPDAVYPKPTTPVATPVRRASPRAALPDPAAAAPVPGGLYVQIAALSDAARASSLAGSVGGSVVAGAGLYRVRVGPYRDQQSAELARDALARQGYAGAHIVANH